MQQGNAVSKRKFAGTDSRFHGRRQISPRFSAQALLLLLLSAPVLLFTTSVAWQRRAAVATAGDVTTSQALNSVDSVEWNGGDAWRRRPSSEYPASGRVCRFPGLASSSAKISIHVSYKNYTEAILSNSTRKLLRFEITKTQIAL